MKLPQTNQLLNKEMTRKQFLQHVGLLILAVVGISNMLASFKNIFDLPARQPRVAQEEPKSKGFGSSKFGV